jgi:hypothetical protein
MTVEASSGTLSDSDESVMERGGVVQLKQKRSSAVNHGVGNDGNDGNGGNDRIEEVDSSGSHHI